MQIHELTKRRKTNEGLLDSMKDGIQAIKTGYKQGGLKGAAKASVSNAAMAQAGQQRQQKQATKGLADLKAQGIDAKTPLSFYVNKVKTDPEATQQRQSIEKEIKAEFDLTPFVSAGQRLVLPGSKTGYPSDYYLSDQGVWSNQLGQAVTDPKTIDKFNDLANGGAAHEEPVPGQQQQGAQKGKGGAAALNKAANAASATAPSAPPAQPVVPLAEAVPRMPPGGLAKRSQQRNTPAAPAAPAAPATPAPTAPAAAPTSVLKGVKSNVDVNTLKKYNGIVDVTPALKPQVKDDKGTTWTKTSDGWTNGTRTIERNDLLTYRSFDDAWRVANGAKPGNVGVPQSTQQSELQKAADPNSQAQQQLAQDPSNAAYKGDPLSPDEKAQDPMAAKKPAAGKKSTKKQLQSDFEAWIGNVLPGFNNIGQDSKAQLKKQFGIILKTKTPQAFDQYVLLAQAAILKAKDEKGMPDSNPVSGDVDDKLSAIQNKTGKKTGNPELDQVLQTAGWRLSEEDLHKKLASLLAESQVYITKDIRVKTAKGDYVKKHEDQQWYDPNGVRIDPTKYAEYIAKLDATPAAQTRYQADAEKGIGSDVGVAKSKEYKAAHQEPEPQVELPKATAADWEAVRAHRNDVNNAMIDKTINDLRNAEYFNTGQKDYLQQQLAQLMAKKF